MQRRSRLCEEQRPSSPALEPALSSHVQSDSDDGGAEAEFTCPICLDTIKEAFMTCCGHSFCYGCIDTHLQKATKCPLCSQTISRSTVFPNFALNKIIARSRPASPGGVGSPVQQLHHSIRQDDELSIPDIDDLLDTLKQKKKQLQDNRSERDLELAAFFLHRSKDAKLEALEVLRREIAMLDDDIDKVDAARKDRGPPKRAMDVGVPSDELDEDGGEGVCGGVGDVAVRKQRIEQHMPELEACYFAANTAPALSPSSLCASPARKKRRISPASPGLSPSQPLSPAPSPSLASSLSTAPLASLFPASHRLATFARVFSQFTHHAQLRTRSVLKSDGAPQGQSVVSSIEFGRDEEYFAVAGAGKKIQIFELGVVLDDPIGVHFPVHEIASSAKVSCLSWNSYIKSQLANSDYAGGVWVWDAFRGAQLRSFAEHTQRVWSVDFSTTNPTLLASASDDCRVKIWSTNQRGSIGTIATNANVCCVQFNKAVSNQLVFGDAGRVVRAYDLRNLSEPLRVFTGHRKAVSLLKFLNADQVVSASTDGSLRCWSLSSGNCVRTYRGHENEKNFVGLSTNGQYIACGSETNEVVVYMAALPSPILSCKFSEGEGQENAGNFVSTVAWKNDDTVLLAGNSQGMVKVLEMC